MTSLQDPASASAAVAAATTIISTEETSAPARLRLEPLSLKHLQGFHELWSDPLTTKWTSRPNIPTKSLDESKAWLETQVANTASNSDVLCNSIVLLLPIAGEDAREETVIGVISIHRPGPPVELGYMFIPSSWGKGYATEALKLFLKTYWSTTDPTEAVRREMIRAWVDLENEPSAKVLRKIGFKEKEIIMDSGNIPNMPGRRDSAIYDMASPEREKLRQRLAGELSALLNKRADLEEKLKGIAEAEAVLKKHFEESGELKMDHEGESKVEDATTAAEDNISEGGNEAGVDL